MKFAEKNEIRMPEKLLITNCKLFDAPDDADAVSILVDGGRIAEVGAVAETCENVLDAGGRTVAPGLIDVHIQGAGGMDIMDAEPEALRTISRTLARFGTTGFLATTVFQPSRENRHLRVAAEAVGADLGGARILGIHLEGPFISPEKRGMIQVKSICPPSGEVLDKILSLVGDGLRMMTIAPELPGNLDLAKRLVGGGVVASFGHSAATYCETLAGFDAGINHVTHLFNAMMPMHHREPGPLPAIFQTETVTAQIICDGVHIVPAMLRLAFSLLGPGRAVPITDGMQAMGMGDGTYVYDGVEYVARDGTAWYHDGTLIGTCLGLNQMVKRFSEFTGCSPADAFRGASAVPAQLLGLGQRKGAIAVGMDADIILVDRGLEVFATIVAGKIVFQKE
ncbi:MAG: N-acetylglucosamine-6-phosphate deacetylase [Planctomycetia bacterium]|nr:N-acetylglucosamine-6-phosphate deacetylase [Planctomycetia bacterium]